MHGSEDRLGLAMATSLGVFFLLSIILMLTAGLFEALMIPALVLMGVCVFVCWYIIGSWPRGEPFSMRCFMLFVCFFCPPWFAGLAIFMHLYYPPIEQSKA
jgi:hypothetical protein